MELLELPKQIALLRQRLADAQRHLQVRSRVVRDRCGPCELQIGVMFGSLGRESPLCWVGRWWCEVSVGTRHCWVGRWRWEVSVGDSVGQSLVVGGLSR